MIKTSFGSLRLYTVEDAEFLARYANNRKIADNLRDGFPHPYTVENAREFIAIALAKTPPTLFAIADADNQVIGGIGLMVKTDVHRFTAELGYWLGEPFWGRGIVTASIKAIVEYGFDKLGLLRIFAEPFDLNIGSSKALEKAGFVFEGRLKNDVFKNGVVRDSLMYAITRSPVI